MSDGLGQFYGEAKFIGRGRGPALPGFALVGAVEAGVDLHAVERLCVAVEVGALGRELFGDLPGERPAGGTDAEVHAALDVGAGG